MTKRTFIEPVIILRCSCGEEVNLGLRVKQYELKNLGCPECEGAFCLIPGELRLVKPKHELRWAKGYTEADND